MFSSSHPFLVFFLLYLLNCSLSLSFTNPSAIILPLLPFYFFLSFLCFITKEPTISTRRLHFWVWKSKHFFSFLACFSPTVLFFLFSNIFLLSIGLNHYSFLLHLISFFLKLYLLRLLLFIPPHFSFFPSFSSPSLFSSPFFHTPQSSLCYSCHCWLIYCVGCYPFSPYTLILVPQHRVPYSYGLHFRYWNGYFILSARALTPPPPFFFRFL